MSFRSIIVSTIFTSLFAFATADDINIQFADSLAAPGSSVDGGSVATNFVRAYNQKQFFLMLTQTILFETPLSDIVETQQLMWCSNLNFSDFQQNDTIPMAFVGRCIYMLLQGLDEIVAEGAQITGVVTDGAFYTTGGLSMTYVPQTNVFQGQTYEDTDNDVHRFWDYGSESMPAIVWETHDEGDLSPNMATSAWSAFGQFDWMSIEDASNMLNMTTDELTPDTFNKIYVEKWIKTHETEAAQDNPNPDAELAIIEEVKNEMESINDVESTNIPTAQAPLTTDELDGRFADSLAAPGKNIEGGSVATNFVKAYNERQLFFSIKAQTMYEKPQSDAVNFDMLWWCSNLEFLGVQDYTIPMGFVGRCVCKVFRGGKDAALAGAQQSTNLVGTDKFSLTGSISRVYVPQTNVFEGQNHKDTDNYVYRYWDDGSETAPLIGWEVHDQGDLSPNQATSAFSLSGHMISVSTKDAAMVLNMTEDELTPDSFNKIYADTWIESHEEEAAQENPNPDAELAIIGEVKNELEANTDQSTKTDSSQSQGLTTDELDERFAGSLAAPGENAEGSSVATNFIRAYNEKQFFMMQSYSLLLYERPFTDVVEFQLLYWCSNLHFSSMNDDNPLGFVGRCFVKLLQSVDEAVAAGAQVTGLSKGFSSTLGISSVYVPQTNVYEGQLYRDTDDFIYRFWDNGSEIMPFLYWETHDDGDLSPNAATSAHSAFGQLVWTSTEDAAKILNMTIDELTPETFGDIYAETWIKSHEKEAAEKNPNPEAELVVVEEVKNEIEAVEDDITGATTDTDTITIDPSDPTDGAADSDSAGHGVSRNLALTTSLLTLFSGML